MKRIAAHETRLALVMLAVGSIYLVPFVARGWFPHDEGMIGQSAERVLRGDIPHVDYDEPYTGALTLLHAAIFKTLGTDLVHIRWMLFIAASAGMVAVYRLLRRYLRPISAALVSWIALSWSFPNYFASLPSWWLLIAAILCLAALIRFVETDRLWYIALAGLAVGTAITIKQTGVYFVFPLTMIALLRLNGDGRESWASQHFPQLARVIFATCSVGFAIWIMRQRLGASEVVYLLLPIIASALTLILWPRFHATTTASLSPCIVALIASSLPVAIFLYRYWIGGHLDDFVRGTLQAPQLRLMFASISLPPAPLILCGPAMYFVLVHVPASLSVRDVKLLRIGRWAAVGILLIASFRYDLAYALTWQSVRSAVSLLPLVSLWMIAFGRSLKYVPAQLVFASSSMLAWASLVQFPFAAPIYFCSLLSKLAGAIAVAREGERG